MIISLPTGVEWLKPWSVSIEVGHRMLTRRTRMLLLELCLWSTRLVTLRSQPMPTSGIIYSALAAYSDQLHLTAYEKWCPETFPGGYTFASGMGGRWLLLRPNHFDSSTTIFLAGYSFATEVKALTLLACSLAQLSKMAVNGGGRRSTITTVWLNSSRSYRNGVGFTVTILISRPSCDCG